MSPHRVSKASHSGTNTNRRTGKPGLTYSKGGVALSNNATGGFGLGESQRRRRKNYPTSWSSGADKARMRKRVLCVYDGPRRLWKDDMMLDREFEVRVPMSGGGYVTDLDVQTLRRAEGIHSATEEERGPWNVEDAL